MQLTIAEATDLATRTLVKHRMPPDCAHLVAEHLVDAALCGHEFSSLPRLLAIVEEIRQKPLPVSMCVVRETPNSAHIDGGDNVAYAVSIFAVDKAIEICRRTGIAAVTVNNTWFSGRLAYYVERAARAGFVAMHTTNTTARVAPFGGIDRVMGTNPFAIAFPAPDDPVIVDIGTSSTTWGDVVLARAKGEPLPEERAVDANGKPTVDPSAALEGAFLAWGGTRGSGLSLAVQLLGMLAGSRAVIEDVSNYGLFFLLLDPALLTGGGDFAARIAEFKSVIHATRPATGVSHVRVPGEGSFERRRRNTAAGFINIDDRVYASILDLCA